jgi:hypothetical protein
MERIRISQGVGSNQKLWAVVRYDDHRKPTTQVGEFDISDEPGRFEGVGAICGMSGIVWCSTGPSKAYPSGVHARKLYRSADEWVEDIVREYPDAVIIRADDEPQDWL